MNDFNLYTKYALYDACVNRGYDIIPIQVYNNIADLYDSGIDQIETLVRHCATIVQTRFNCEITEQDIQFVISEIKEDIS